MVMFSEETTPVGKLKLNLMLLPPSSPSRNAEALTTRLAGISSSSAMFSVTGVGLTAIAKPNPAVFVPESAILTVSVSSRILSSITFTGTST
ncbi:hypothetical protein D3C86_767860 [compost metagenome]